MTSNGRSAPNLRSTQRALIGATFGGAFWGLSGTAAQALFQIYGFPAATLVTIRMLIAGAILLGIIRPSLPRAREDLGLLFLIAVFGIAASQLSYLFAIQYSNSPTGTLLQFLFLPIVASYEALRGFLKWSARWTIALALAATGTVLLIGVFSSTGRMHVLITPIGLIAGLVSAVTGAYYSLASRDIVRKRGSWWVVTWGFVIGGLVSSPFGIYSVQGYVYPASVTGEIGVVFLILFVVVFGTIFAFGLYLAGLQKLSATETGIAASFEPITAALAAYFFLGTQLGFVQYVGGGLIIVAVILIASKPIVTPPIQKTDNVVSQK
jgi:drug/metabolite transporter (DMT)-like permease